MTTNNPLRHKATADHILSITQQGDSYERTIECICEVLDRFEDAVAILTAEKVGDLIDQRLDKVKKHG